MAYNPPHYTEDPATGEVVGMRELSERHDLPYPTICKRYSAGWRGWKLVQPIDEIKSRGGQAFAEKRKRLRSPSPYEQLAQNPVNAAMMRPMRPMRSQS